MFVGFISKYKELIKTWQFIQFEINFLNDKSQDIQSKSIHKSHSLILYNEVRDPDLSRMKKEITSVF